MTTVLNKLYIPISKIDEEKRLVYGILASETPDHSGEIFDYDGSRKAIVEWRESRLKASGGKSQGNLRVMHTEKVAGHFDQIELDDENKKVLAVAKVVDDDEWKHVLEGDYTGFSIGARACKREKDATNPKLVRYTVGKMIEGSLCDAPCNPETTFEIIKADGTHETRKFNQGVSARPAYEYPVAQQFSSQFKVAKAALEKVGADAKASEFLKATAQSAGLKKSLWDVSDLASCLMSRKSVV